MFGLSNVIKKERNMSIIDEINADTSESYVNELTRIGRSDNSADKKLELVNIVIKDFLRKKYHIKKNSEYSELIDFFLVKKKPSVAAFCHEMVEELYSGDEVNESKIQLIIEDSKAMIKKEIESKVKYEEMPMVKEIFNPFGKVKKIEQKTSAEDNISKQSKKLIDRYLSNQEISEVTQDRDKINEREMEEMEYMKSKLKLNSREDDNPIVGIDAPENIQNIDNLDRIKYRIYP